MITRFIVGPTSAESRVQIVDIIRGFALFGVLLVNAPTMNSPVYMDATDFAFQFDAFDYFVTSFIFSFAGESFYPIFALLFGFGAANFLKNKTTNGGHKLFCRRMMILLGIGVCHATLVWWGDILIIYAVLGFLLLPLLNMKPKALLKLIFLLLAATITMSIAMTMLETQGEATKRLDLIYNSGSFVDITQKRIKDYLDIYILPLFQISYPASLLSTVTYYVHLLAVMLLGAWFQKRALFKNLFENRKFFLILCAGAAIVSLVATPASWSEPWGTILMPVRGLSRSLFYISSICVLARWQPFMNLVSPLANVGRMSLTNYLAHTTTLSLILYNYGLGMYGRIGPARFVPMVVFIYAISLMLSKYWLRSHQFGPIEWLWRKATYGFKTVGATHANKQSPPNIAH